VNGEPLPFSAACERNREPILAVLREAFRDRHEVLEIGSGTGQHAVYFAAALPRLRWQPTERTAQLAGLGARLALEGPTNLRPALALDLAQPAWPAGPAGGLRWDAAFSANTLHIVAAPLVERFFAGLGAALAANARLAVYGPFRYRGRFTTASNADFDAALRQRDPASGIRDVEWIDSLAAAQGFQLEADHPMPANNQLRVWARG
jgi:SAM-dependent methyltransferase